MDALLEIGNRKSVLFDPPDSRLERRAWNFLSAVWTSSRIRSCSIWFAEREPATTGKFPIAIETGPITCTRQLEFRRAQVLSAWVTTMDRLPVTLQAISPNDKE
jgi:hypothetical protein